MTSNRSAATPDTATLLARISQLERALADSSAELQLRSALDQMFEGVQIISHDLRYLYLNDTAVRHARQKRENLLGRTLIEMYPNLEHMKVYALIKKCLVERVPQTDVNLFTYPDGATGWFEVKIEPVPMGALILSSDVTEAKKAEESLRQIREDLSATLECMAEGVIATDVDGRVTRMNPSAEKLTGWTQAEAAGHPLDSLVRFLSQRTGEVVEHPVEKILKQGLKLGLANGTLLITRAGMSIPVASSGAPVRDAAGNLRGVVVVLKDMHEEYELTSRLHQSAKMEAIGRLAGGVAHDFNNLLTVINAYGDMLVDGLGKADPLRPKAEEVRKAGEAAAGLTRQLLAFSRKQMMKPRPMDLNASIERMTKMLSRLIGENIQVSTRLAPGLRPVMADPGQVEQVLLNLAVNAKDAMPRGGRLTIETAFVELDDSYARMHFEARPGPHIVITVTDTGIGMDAETQARIFEPFFTTKGLGRGTGLGLSTVYGIVQQSGGNIWVYSEPGKGTTFKVYFPCGADGSAEAAPAKPGHARAPGARTVLVVEDDSMVRGVIGEILKNAGYTVLETGEGEEAVRMCRQHPEEIHLLLTDVVMPGMGGPEVARDVQEIRPRIKVVYMSGYTDNVITEQGVLPAGIAFLEKPVSAGVLLQKLRQMLA